MSKVEYHCHFIEGYSYDIRDVQNEIIAEMKEAIDIIERDEEMTPRDFMWYCHDVIEQCEKTIRLTEQIEEHL